ncbi:carboxylic acid reductase [Saccharopolyspora phatthalungensis]|uniref:Carboxylic acid reductase n=1 Tax=Saccharopolyspora phatthalungensis TaxID=664693 RepID=A0A840Q103_9PSEU|nr:carboxylic acid reductase [Saccharopolyspora phatthalungensis]MBB5153650.1 fatty acid CoA ligase FadD9 [Saccharopolyspora phatthalungensis]
MTVATSDPKIGDGAEQPLAHLVESIMARYADRPALGDRATEVVTDPVTGRGSLRLRAEFDTTSYAQLWSRARAVAAEWHCDSRQPVGAGDIVALFGFASSDYVTVDLACLSLGAVPVPLQPSASLAHLRTILDETAPRVLAVGIEYLDKAVELVLVATTPPRLIVFDYRPEIDDQREAFETARNRLAAIDGVVIDSLAAVVDRGATLPAAALHTPPADEDPIGLVIYTSGSTGTPKGAIYTERMVRRYWARLAPKTDPAPPVCVSYMPLTHMAGRNLISHTLSQGGLIYFTAKSDLSTLFEDIGLARPTQIRLVPRICDMLFQEYQSECDRRAGEFADSHELDAAVKTDLRERFFGGRVRQANLVSALLSAEMKSFVESCLQINLHDIYASTETGLVLTDGRIQRPPVIDYKLVDVPELGYFRTDRPYPRGELLVKTEAIMAGYYKRLDVTASVFDEDGFYQTGDIMAEIGPDQLAYLDRRNNVLKLSQGEFVAVAGLEATFATSPLIRQIFVYGSSERAYLLAVIVPTDGALRQAGNVAALKPLLSQSLQRIAKDAGLQSYEVPRDFLIETEPFTVQNGLLSDVRKLLRPRLKERYAAQLERLYVELAQDQADQLHALRQHGAQRPVYETVCTAAQALLGCASVDLEPDARFSDLGGDSLSALSFSTLLREIFDIEVSVGVITSPATTLRTIANQVESQRDGAATRPTFASVHDPNSREVRAGQLTLDRFLDAETIAAAANLPRPDGHAPATVLLTGANGFLGRFMCLDWLERLAEHDGSLICIVRGADATAARRRLDAAFDTGDPDLTRHYRHLAAAHLEVLAGDVSQDRLGLDRATWNRLADEVDLIMHPAALVNHVLPYDQLFGPNVVGTAELIRLAITGRIKPFTYLSTVGIAGQLDSTVLDETGDVRELNPVRTLGDGYASGYSTSKWAGEVVLREAHDACGLPVSTFRSDLIMAHSRYAGQLNVPDMFTRLLLSLVATGVAPASFYRGDHGVRGRSRAHYDGLPVEFTAEAINTLGAGNIDGYQTFNVMNPHDDGISLDTFIDWLIDTGHDIHRIDDYDEWLTRFSTAIRGLPERQRQYSMLPLLHAIQHPGQPVAGSMIPADRFRAAVREAKIGDDRDIPHLSFELIRKYVADLKHVGLL